jgi:hypothetical protein
MMKSPNGDAVLGAGLTCIVGGVVFFLWRGIGPALEMHASDWAAWVQAIFSIVAIVAAIAIASRQERHSEMVRATERAESNRLRADEARRSERRALALARQAVRQARVAADTMHTQLLNSSINREECASLFASAGSLLNECLRTPVPDDALDAIWKSKQMVDRLSGLIAQPYVLFNGDTNGILVGDRSRLSRHEAAMQELFDLLDA